MEEKIQFCKGGGCTAKLGPGMLNRVLECLPKGERDENLLIGYDSYDDAAVYKVNDEQAIVQTLDFFPPMVEDPYIFGQIAATNALSDIYAMGGRVLTALNIVCFPEKMDLNILGQIMLGGAEKVKEAGGHSIVDESVKYGLSVTGIVHPDKILANNSPQAGDALILTKKLGVGLICTANRVNEASEEDMEEAIRSMTTLNKYAAEVLGKYTVHACTDVTGFGFLGHLHEMLDGRWSAVIESRDIPYMEGAYRAAEEFYLTAAAQRNRNHVQEFVSFGDVPFAMEEILYDPQTSGGLLAAVSVDDAEQILEQLQAIGLPARIVGRVIDPSDKEIIVR